MNRHLQAFLRKATAIVAAVAIAAGPAARGEVLLSWDFAGNTGSEATVTAGTIDSNLGAGSGVISRGAGLTASDNGHRFNATSWATTNFANAISGDDYMEFSLNFNDTHSFSIDDIAFSWERSATGPRELALRSSLDSYAADIQTLRLSITRRRSPSRPRLAVPRIADSRKTSPSGSTAGLKAPPAAAALKAPVRISSSTARPRSLR